MRSKVTENVENGIIENNYFFSDTSVRLLYADVISFFVTRKQENVKKSEKR